MTVTTVPSMCRVCTNLCPIDVELTDGRPTRIRGAKPHPVYHGYTCIKGRAQLELLDHPNRLLTSKIRDDEGVLQPASSGDVVDHVARRLSEIIAEHGPRAVATYSGNGVIAGAGTGQPLANAFMRAIGSPMMFTSVTIDKPGKLIAQALHGHWDAPSQGFDDPDVVLLIGINPLLTYTGLPAGNPGKWLNAALDGGTELLVIDPRRSDVAKRASQHLQAAPGYDAAIIAALIHVIVAERLYDAEFVAAHVGGLDELAKQVAEFTPEAVAAVAGVEPEELRRMARTYAGASRGYVMAGTGPSMSGPGTLTEYLILDLETLCGRWLRAGERVRQPGAWYPGRRHVARALPPSDPRTGAASRIRGLVGTVSGMPTATVPDEILTPGEGQVRALILYGGNPVVAWPDQLKTIEALSQLELLVTLDPFHTETTRLAHVAVATKLPLEVASTSQIHEQMGSLGTGYGTAVPYAQYAEPVLEPPPGSDLLEEWEFYVGLAQRMGLELDVPGLDVAAPPESAEDLLRLTMAGSRVPFDEIKRHPHGAVFDDEDVVVEAAPDGWEGRFELASAEMMTLLDEEAARLTAAEEDADFPFRLVCRRHMHVYNSTMNLAGTNHGRPYNPAFLHPDDLDRLGLDQGDVVDLVADAGRIPAVVHPEPGLRPGLVSMAFGFGGAPERDDEHHEIGSSVSRLVRDDDGFDPFSGQPRMSNVPIRVEPAPE